jgi:hypothetical protein
MNLFALLALPTCATLVLACAASPSPELNVAYNEPARVAEPVPATDEDDDVADDDFDDDDVDDKDFDDDDADDGIDDDDDDDEEAVGVLVPPKAAP